MDESELSEEILLLEEIYIQELEVKRNSSGRTESVALQLHPATGEDLEQRYVCMTLILDLPEQYPDVSPEFTIKNPRGVNEEEIQSLLEDMHKLCEERRGGPVLYELIEDVILLNLPKTTENNDRKTDKNKRSEKGDKFRRLSPRENSYSKDEQSGAYKKVKSDSNLIEFAERYDKDYRPLSGFRKRMGRGVTMKDGHAYSDEERWKEQSRGRQPNGNRDRTKKDTGSGAKGDSEKQGMFDKRKSEREYSEDNVKDRKGGEEDRKGITENNLILTTRDIPIEVETEEVLVTLGEEEMQMKITIRMMIVVVLTLKLLKQQDWVETFKKGMFEMIQELIQIEAITQDILEREEVSVDHQIGDILEKEEVLVYHQIEGMTRNLKMVIIPVMLKTRMKRRKQKLDPNSKR
ncbi:RNF25-like protein [Mya arenaria]|uniref:RNF25-like protein n=1 Tax=Mya arenaria TaxID=6604 RepID=A0ABY7DZJ4_MYAAR|nr:RNF25-like protein [Mya arenaria]